MGHLGRDDNWRKKLKSHLVIKDEGVRIAMKRRWSEKRSVVKTQGNADFEGVAEREGSEVNW